MKKLLILLMCLLCASMCFAAGQRENDTISVITREEGSGTRSAFVEIVGLDESGEDETTLDAIVHDGTGKVITAVSNDSLSIGYISLGSLNDSVKGLSLNGVKPTKDNIKKGTYKLARPFNIAYANEISSLAEDFITFIISDVSQNIANEEGFISIYSGNSYKSSNQKGTLNIGGSTSVYPLMEKIAEEYIKFNPNVKINIEGIGSSAGVKGAIDKTFEIGMASRALKDSELSKINGMEIAQDGIALIVNNENLLSDITLENIKEIYLGNITKYSDL